MIVCSHVILFQPPPFLLPAVDAYLVEHNSFNNIYQLVVQCCECLSLWKLLCEHQFHLTANGLSLVSTRTMYWGIVVKSNGKCGVEQRTSTPAGTLLLLHVWLN